MKRNIFSLLAAASIAAIVLVSCEKKNVDPTDDDDQDEVVLHESLKGTDYAIIFMDDATAESIIEKVSLDLRVNDANVNWWDWAGNTMILDCTGNNFYGLADTEWLYIKLADNSAGWSGAGMNVTSDTPGLKEYFARVAAAPEKYYLHIAYKSTQSGKGNVIYPAWYTNDAFKVSIGEVAQTVYDATISADDEKDLITPLSGAYKANEWNEYEICVKDFNYDYAAEYTDANTNVFCVLPGTEVDKECQLDAVFYYRKN